MTTTTHNRAGTIYNKKFYAAYNGQYAGDALSPEIIRQARKYIKGNVLDVGAGSGAMIDLLRNLPETTEVHGIDIAPTRAEILEASIEKLPFWNDYYHCVICSEVLEHLDDETLSKGMQEIFRVMKPSGYLIITTPYKDNLQANRVVCPHCKGQFDRWGHIRSFDENSMKELVSIFEIKQITPLSLGFLNAHKRLRYFMPLLKTFGFFKGEESLFVVAQKPGKKDIMELTGWEYNDML